jgi:hypothetical protein
MPHVMYAVADVRAYLDAHRIALVELRAGDR